MRRTGICGATETLLVDRAVAGSLLPALLQALKAAGCAIRGDATVRRTMPETEAATEEDWETEYLAPIIAVKVVDGLDEAIAHINRPGSHHTEAIVTEDAVAATRSEEHTSELQSLMRNSYAVFSLNKKKLTKKI